jgi:bifunctional enzyme CysN/CysC
MDSCTNVAIVGHVDHGKSTIIGRLLADTKSLPENKLDQIKAFCRKNARPFEYAFLLDALKNEQAQGITIDIARCFFKTKKSKYLILDTPGHIEFLKNMVTGAANAHAALLVIDANEGIQENSRRHAYMLSMLNIKQVIVLVNKMDLVSYDENVFRTVINDYQKFLANINLSAKLFIPVSGMHGDNIATQSSRLPWYDGVTVLESLDQLKKPAPLMEKPFRLSVQDVYKFTQDGDSRRIITGRIDSGQLSIGDMLTFYPSGKSSRVKTFEAFNATVGESATAGSPVGFTLTEQIYIKRGEVAVKSHDDSLRISSRFVVSLFWLGIEPLQLNKEYRLKIGTAKIGMCVEKIVSIINASSLNYQKSRHRQVKRHEVAECVIRLYSSIACDFSHEHPITSRFVIIDHYNIVGGGIIQKNLLDSKENILSQVQKRNILWITSSISREERASKYGHGAALMIVTGQKGACRQHFARKLERALFDLNKKVYYLGIGNVVHGIDADINRHNRKARHEHLRRFAEVLNILLDTGHIVIVTAIELNQEALDLIKLRTNCDKTYSIWMGSNNALLKVDRCIENIIKDIDIVNTIIEDFSRLYLN